LNPALDPIFERDVRALSRSPAKAPRRGAGCRG
jgi:hypothetical protein